MLKKPKQKRKEKEKWFVFCFCFESLRVRKQEKKNLKDGGKRIKILRMSF